MLTRRDFLYSASAVTVAAAAAPGLALDLPAGEAFGSAPCSEPNYLGQPLGYWLERLFTLKDTSYCEADRIRAATAAFGEQVVPALRQALHEGDRQAQNGVLAVFREMGPLGESELKKAVRHPCAAVREHAIFILGYAFPAAPGLAGLLDRALDDEDANVRRIAAARVGEVRLGAKPIMEKALRHPDAAVRLQVVCCILRIELDRAAARRMLVRLLHDSDGYVRLSAIQELFLEKPVDPGVVPALLRLVAEGMPQAADWLPFAGEIGLRELLRLLEHGELPERAAAAQALERFVVDKTAPYGRPTREPSPAETDAVLIAFRRAARENDLAVSGPAQRVVSALAPS